MVRTNLKNAAGSDNFCAEKVGLIDGRKEQFDERYNEKIKDFVEYYKKQGVLKNEDIDAIKGCLKTELPICFWFSGKDGNLQSLFSTFKGLNNKLGENKVWTFKV